MLGLTGFAVTAFGIAPLVPDAANLPKRLVTENVPLRGLQAQLDALASNELDLYRTDVTRSSDTADSLLRRLNVSDAAAAAFLRNDALGRKVLDGRGGKMIQVRSDGAGNLTELVARYAITGEQAVTHFNRLRVVRVGAGLQAAVEVVPLSVQVRVGSGTVQSTLYAATDDAGIPDSVASRLVDVLATDIDFHRELHRGDTFSVVYEAPTADGESIPWGDSSGRLLGAEFVNNGRRYSAVWFQQGEEKGGYFGLDGQSKRRAFLASPLEFSRVTSGFAMRLHPILNSWKQHKGVDYGAPSGTLVRSVGEGLVDFAGWQNGYGNVVEIRHTNQRTTVYAHLSRIDVRREQRVEQGQSLGAVGATGWATGPHLHFEVKVQGLQTNPLALATASDAVNIAAPARAQFAQLTTNMKKLLDMADSVSRSGTRAE